MKKIEKDDASINNIKIGHFQLQTKSFWISVISIICSFILITLYMILNINFKYLNKMLEQQEKLIEIIIDSKSSVSVYQ